MAEPETEESPTIEEQLLHIKNPFEDSIQSFEKLISWGLAISAGTLLWFAGNFDKFTIRCDQGNTSVPFHFLYLSTISILSISSLSFGFIQLRLYYAKFNYSSKAESAMLQFLDISNKIKNADFSPQNVKNLMSYKHEMDAANATAKAASEDLGKSKEYIFSNTNNMISLIGGISYFCGIFCVALYYYLFIYIYR
jgi:hypothetical protein